MNGIWSTLPSLPSGYNPDAYASAVLADGRAVLVGGEYNNGNFALTNMGAIYDPKANTWTMLTPPATGSPNNFQCIGDAPATVLADGRLLIGSKLFQNLAVLDPANLTWTIVAETGKNDTFNSEEGWTLLPDGSVFTLDVAKAPASERFLLTASATGIWVTSGNTLQDLHTPTTSGPLQAPGCPVYDPPGEMGPALLRPDGTVFAIGASGFTGIYTPSAAGTTAPGSWAIGPAMAAGLNVEDGPAALLPSGHVLFGGSLGDSGTGLQYFEFDGLRSQQCARTRACFERCHLLHTAVGLALGTGALCRWLDHRPALRSRLLAYLQSRLGARHHQHFLHRRDSCNLFH